MNIKSLTGIMFLIITLIQISCIPDDKFELSGFNDIKAFEIQGQAGTTSINKAEKTIRIPFDEESVLTGLVPSRIEISNLAFISPGEGEPQDFTNPVIYTVTAENGTKALWEVTATRAVPTPQLDNSDLNLWYDAGGYLEPGESKNNTIWGTANKGLTILGDPNTLPEDLGGGDLVARMVSVKAPALVRMAAATLYTGKFKDGFPNPADPRSNIIFGTPFTARPSAFRVKYKYQAGNDYLDAKGNPLTGADQADIYVLLQNREGGQNARIGTGWYRDGLTVPDWKTIEIPIKYGPLSSADPEFEYANIREDEIWGNSTGRPTHIVVVFSSSALGDFFTGAIGSELWVNDFELVYQ
jgi:hypothetical protein